MVPYGDASIRKPDTESSCINHRLREEHTGIFDFYLWEKEKTRIFVTNTMIA